jgi:hypothetical protein
MKGFPPTLFFKTKSASLLKFRKYPFGQPAIWRYPWSKMSIEKIATSIHKYDKGGKTVLCHLYEDKFATQGTF